MCGIKRGIKPWGLVLALLASVGVPGAAQAPSPAAAPVVAIAVQPAPGRAAGDYRGLVSQPLGQPPRRDRIRDSIAALYATGQFADIQAIAYPAPGGLRLVFATQPNFFISQVQVAHAPDPPADTELDDASGLSIGAAYSPALLAQAQAKISDRLRSYGYHQARVVPSVALDPSTSQAAIAFTVAPGPLARAGQVAFTGDPLFDAATLRRAIHWKTGAPFSRERLEDASAALQAFYGKQGRLTASVAVAATTYRAAANQLDVRFAIVAGPRVMVAVEGMKLSPGVLRQQIPIYQEHAADADLVEEGRANLVSYLQSQGYFEARVAARRTPVNPAELRIVYEVEAGPKEALAAVAFVGNRYFDAGDLAERIAVRPATAWPGLLPGAGGRFSQALARGDAAAIAQLYRASGFAAVEVTPVIVPNFQGRPRRVALDYRIVEGPQTLVRRLLIAGASPANRATVARLLTTARGQPFAESSLAADRNAILAYYYNHGYQSATCDSQAIPDDSEQEGAGSGEGGHDLEDVTFTVHEGAVETVHRIYIAGDHYVRPGVITHQIALVPGQPLGQLALLQSQRALYDTGLFTSATVVPRNPEGDLLAKDVFVTVNEARRYTFSEGFGLQVQGGTGGPVNLQDVLGHTGYSPLFSFDATRTAVGGRAQTLSLSSTYGALQKRAVLGYGVPDFLSHPALRADFTTFYDDTFDVRTFRAIREQVGAQLQQSLGNADGWAYSLDVHRVRVISPLLAPSVIPIFSRAAELAAFSANFHRDRRDDPLDTRQGTYNSFQAGVDQSLTEGFNSFARLDFQNRGYHALSRDGGVVFARSTQLGFELPFGGRQLLTYTNPITNAEVSSLDFVLPLPERYLSGGADSLRGFSIDQAGPRDPLTGFPVGGEALLVNNFELRFPLIGPNIGGVVFYDLGNVYSTPRNLLRALARWNPPVTDTPVATDTDFTSHTLGLGLRYHTPVGPVRLDTGYLLNPPTFKYFSTGPNPQVLYQRLPPFHFFFSIGETF